MTWQEEASRRARVAYRETYANAIEEGYEVVEAEELAVDAADEAWLEYSEAHE